MKYILDSSGYVESASCNPISCDDKVSQEYTGTIPSGYDSLDDWILNANIRAYKITNGNLVYDAARDEELQAEWAKNPNMLFESETGATGSVSLNKSITNYKKLRIYARTNGGVECSTTIKTSAENVRLCAVDNNASGKDAWLKVAYYEVYDQELKLNSCFWKNINSSTNGTDNAIKIYEVEGLN